MKLTVRQTEAFKVALSGDKDIVLFGGAIRGGKSYWLLLTFIALCSRYPRSRWVIIRESEKSLLRTIVTTFRNILDAGLHAHVESFVGNPPVAKFKNGSELIFMAESYDADKELNRFRGLEVNRHLLHSLTET